MSRILIFVEQAENRRLLAEWLRMHYEVMVGESVVQAGKAVPLLDESFDLCILDGPALNHLWEWVQARKRAEQPVFLPFLLITIHPDVKFLTRHLWQSVDELIAKPIEKLELQARVEMLLRSRRFSLQLQTTNQQLQHEIAERDRAQAEREVAISKLGENEIRFRRLVESNIIGIIVADLKGNIIDANDAFLEIVGYTRDELVAGKIRWDAMTPPEYGYLDDRSIAEIQSKGFCTPFEKEYFRKDGSRVAIQLGVALLDEVQQTTVCFVLDISDRKQAEAEIQHALARERELNELKSSFVSMVSHEFRSPLNTISGFTSLLERRNLSQERQADFFRRIQDAVSRMIALLDDVLIISSSTSGKLGFNPVPLDIKSFCQRLLEEIKISNACDRTIHFICEGGSITAPFDEALLRQILINLLSNALKYSAPDSTVEFKLECESEVVIFQVQDEGIGISPQDLERLFDSFYRASNVGSVPGTGLGLAIAKQAVERHGGTITVNSEINVGTTFTVTLPVTEKSY